MQIRRSDIITIGIHTEANCVKFKTVKIRSGPTTNRMQSSWDKHLQHAIIFTKEVIPWNPMR